MRRSCPTLSLRIIMAGAVASSLMACDESETGPSPPRSPQYSITATIWQNLGDVTVNILRSDDTEPPATSVTVSVDSVGLYLMPWSTEDDALFWRFVEPLLGSTHELRVALTGLSTVAIIEARRMDDTLTMTTPSPDSRYYLAGQPLSIAWEYFGEPTTAFILRAGPFGVDVPEAFFADTLSSTDLGTIVPDSVTSYWSQADSVYVGIEAQRWSPIVGELASEGSRSVARLVGIGAILHPSKPARR